MLQLPNQRCAQKPSRLFEVGILTNIPLVLNRQMFFVESSISNVWLGSEHAPNDQIATTNIYYYCDGFFV